MEACIRGRLAHRMNEAAAVILFYHIIRASCKCCIEHAYSLISAIRARLTHARFLRPDVYATVEHLEAQTLCRGIYPRAQLRKLVLRYQKIPDIGTDPAVYIRPDRNYR